MRAAQYSLVNSPTISEEKAVAIAKSLKDLRVPYRYLRENSHFRKAYDLAKAKNQPYEEGSFSEDAQRFIALIHLCLEAENNEKTTPNLGDLVLILRKCLQLPQYYPVETLDHVLAALTYSLPVLDFIALCLEFAPAYETFNPKTGICRGNEFYAKFFPPFAGALGKDYIDQLANKIYPLVAQWDFIEVKIAEHKAELIPKSSKAILSRESNDYREDSAYSSEIEITDDKLSAEARNFREMLIRPTVTILLESAAQIPNEFRIFLYHFKSYMETWNAPEIDIPQQLFGIFFLRFVFPELANPLYMNEKKLEPGQQEAIKLITAYIQKMTTVWKDPELIIFMRKLAQNAAPEHFFLPFRDPNIALDKQDLSGKEPVFKQFQGKAYKESALRLFGDWAAEMNAAFEESTVGQTPRASGTSSEEASLVPRLGRNPVPIEAGIKPHERTPLTGKKTQAAKCCAAPPTFTAKFLLVLIIFVIAVGALLGNSVILKEDLGLKIDPGYEKLGPVWTSVIWALPGAFLLAIWIAYHMRESHKAKQIKQVETFVFTSRDNERPTHYDTVTDVGERDVKEESEASAVLPDNNASDEEYYFTASHNAEEGELVGDTPRESYGI